MTERNDRLRSVNHLITGRRTASRSTRIVGAVVDRILEQGEGKMTGRVLGAILVVLGVVGLAFVAYRLLVLDFVMDLVRERA